LVFHSSAITEDLGRMLLWIINVLNIILRGVRKNHKDLEESLSVTQNWFGKKCRVRAGSK